MVHRVILRLVIPRGSPNLCHICRQNHAVLLRPQTRRSLDYGMYNLPPSPPAWAKEGCTHPIRAAGGKLSAWPMGYAQPEDLLRRL